MTTGSDPRRIACSPLPAPAGLGRPPERGPRAGVTRIRAREASSAPEQPPAGHVPSLSSGRFAAVLAWHDAPFKVGQLWHADPPSLADEWHRQMNRPASSSIPRYYGGLGTAGSVPDRRSRRSVGVYESGLLVVLPIPGRHRRQERLN
jgi:hypothetical protein